MSNEDIGLETRMKAHARAQAQAGKGYLGALTRVANNAKEFGMNQLSIAGSALGFNVEKRLNSTQRAAATNRGLDLNEKLDENKRESHGEPNTKSAFNNPALSAALLKGPGSMHKQSKVTEEKRMENAWMRSRSGEDSWSNTFSAGKDKIYGGVESAARALGVPERLTQHLTHARQEREDSRGIAGQIRSTTQSFLEENQEASQAEDVASNYRMAASKVKFVGKAVAKGAGVTGLGALGVSVASSAVSAGLNYRAGQFSQNASEAYEKTSNEAYEKEHGVRAAGDEMFKKNISSELARGNAAQARASGNDIKKEPGNILSRGIAGTIDKAAGADGILGFGIGKALGALRGTASGPDKNKAQARSGNAEAARNAQVLARNAGHQNPVGSDYDKIRDVSVLSTKDRK